MVLAQEVRHMTERNVLVTGGSGGIGRAIINRCIADGYSIINLDRVAPKTLLKGEMHYQADLTDAQATRDILQRITRDHQVLRVINNAGFIRPGTLEDATLEDFDAVCALNLRAPMLVAQGLQPGMQAARFGRIINISSRAALGKELRTVYSATKAGLLGMTRTWALELAPYGVTVNAIGPGPIATELFLSGNPPDSPKTKKILESIPLKRMGEPDDIAHAVASLLDDRAGYITGQVLYVCGGLTVGLGQVA